MEKKYESVEQKIFRVAYPPVLYYFLMMAAQMIVGFVAIVLEFDKKTSANASDSANFFENIISAVTKYSVLCNAVSAMLGIIIFLFIYRDDVNKRERMSLKEQLGNMELRSSLSCYLIGITLCTGISMVLSLLPIDGIFGSYEDTSKVLLNSSFVWLFLCLGILVPLAEELLYRAVIYFRLKEYLGAKKAIIISALLFGVFHFNLLQGLYAFVVGILLALAVEKYNSIFASVLMHMAVNQLSVIWSVTGWDKKLGNNILIYLFFMVILLGIGAMLLIKSEIIKNLNDK